MHVLTGAHNEIPVEFHYGANLAVPTMFNYCHPLSLLHRGQGFCNATLHFISVYSISQNSVNQMIP